MKMYRNLIVGLLATGTLTAVGSNTAVRAAGDEKIKLNGCVIKAEGDDGYLISNVPSEPDSTTADRTPARNAIGTAGAYANVFYWLKNDDELKKAFRRLARQFLDANRGRSAEHGALAARSMSRRIDIDG